MSMTTLTFEQESLPITWKDQPVTILGLSKTGMAVASYLVHQGAQCFLSDISPETPKNKAQCDVLRQLGVQLEMGGHSRQCFTHSKWVVVSPGIPPTTPLMRELQLSGKHILSEVMLAYVESQKIAAQQQRRLPWIGITGTNGKTTTTSLIAHILKQARKNAPACGNIGVPIIALLEASPLPDVLVAELSSYQLNFAPAMAVDIAILTNLKPDHLDWHGSYQAYQTAKQQLFLPVGTQKHPVRILPVEDAFARSMFALNDPSVLWFSLNPELLQEATNAISQHQDSQQVWIRWQGAEPAQKPAESADQKIDLPICLNQLKIVGAHNQENALMAIAATWIYGLNADAIQAGVLSFTGVEHRLERVTETNGVVFYNDSKATNPDATISALNAFEDKVILIAGGRDKMGPLADLAASIQQHCHSVVLFGEATQRFQQAFQAAGLTQLHTADSLEAAVSLANTLAKQNQIKTVLFSPACASFDMFDNFEHRGECYKTMVKK